MGKTKAQIAKEKEHAKLLYTTQGITNQKELAQRVGTSTTSINKWINESKWETLRASVIMTREEEIKRLYNRLTFLNDSMDQLQAYYIKAAREIESTEDQKTKDFLTAYCKDIINQIAKLSDALSKGGAAIRSLETDVSIAEYMEVCQKLIQHVSREDFDFGQKLTAKADEFIKERLK